MNPAWQNKDGKKKPFLSTGKRNTQWKPKGGAPRKFERKRVNAVPAEEDGDDVTEDETEGEQEGSEEVGFLGEVTL